MTNSIKIAIFVSVICFSCQHGSFEDHTGLLKPVISPTFDSAHWSPEILSAIDSFVDEVNCRNCIYELYVNKVLPRYSLVNLKARPSSIEYMNGKNPLFTTDIKGRRFFIYSGLEDFLVGDGTKIQIGTDSGGTIYKNWTVIIKDDSLKINRQGGYPFFPSDDETPEKFTKTATSSHRK
jgi:hypothetical protein